METNIKVSYKSQWDDDAGGTNNDCGPASIAMILNYFGENLATDRVFKLTSAGSGLIGFDQMLKAIKALGYQAERLANSNSAKIRECIDRDIPVIALVKYGSLVSTQDKKFKGGHFFVVVGYRDDGYFVNDPNFKGDMRSHGDHHFYTKQEFEKAWRDSALDKNQPNSLIVIQRKVSSNPGTMPEKNEPMITIPTKDRDDLIARSAKLDEFDKREITVQRFEEVSKEASSKNEVIKKLEEDHTRFVERVAELIGSPKDENSVIEFCSRFDSSINDAVGYKDKYERLVVEKAKDASDHIAAFTTLNNQVIEIKRNYDKEINGMQQKIDLAIKDAHIANEALKTATKFAEFWKWVVSRFSNSLVEKGKNV